MRDTAAYDFLSGISLGDSPSGDRPERVSREYERSHQLQQSIKGGNGPKLEATPSKSIPITPRSGAVSRHVTASYQSDSTLEENYTPTTPEEDSAIYEAADLLFGVGDESPQPPPILQSMVLTSKTFTSAPKKIIKSMASGQRTLYGFPALQSTQSKGGSHMNSNHRPASHFSQSIHHHNHHHQHHGEITSMPAPQRAYGAVVISSILCYEKDSSSSNIAHGTSTAYHHTSAPVHGIASSGSDVSDDEQHSGESPASSSSRYARAALKHGIKMLQFKKKSHSVSYQRYLVPSAKSAELNRQIIAKLPTFSLPRTIMGSAEIFHSADESPIMDSPSGTPRTPRTKKSTRDFDLVDSPNSPTRPTATQSLKLSTVQNRPITTGSLDQSGGVLSKTADSGSKTPRNKSSSAEIDVPSNQYEYSGKKPKSHRSKHTGELEADAISAPPTKSRSQSMSAPTIENITLFQPQLFPDLSSVSSSSAGPDALPQSPALVAPSVVSGAAPTPSFHALDPYQKCLQSYDPGFLDHVIEKSGKYLVKSHLPGYTSSIMPLKPAKLARQEENEAFANRHTWLTTDLKLSKLRSVKRKLEQVAISQSLDIACTAFAYVYFEKLILRNVVFNNNARLLGAVCLLLAAKYYGVKMPSFSPLVKELANKLKVAPKEIVSSEFFVFRKLKFALFVEDDEVLPHFWKLRSSPNYLDKEFQVSNKERKKNLKKKQVAAAAAAAAASAGGSTGSSIAP